jgi:hypothetical protein
MPRTRKGTTLVIEPFTPPRSEPEPDTDAQDFLYNHEDKTPVAPPPSGSMLNHAGLGFFQRFRPVLLAGGALIVIAGTFLLGAAMAGWGKSPEPSIITVTSPGAAGESDLEVAPLESEAAVLAAGAAEEDQGQESGQGQEPGAREPGQGASEHAGVAAGGQSAPAESEGESAAVPLPLPGEVPSPPTVADTVFLSVTVSPANARVSIDRQRMPSNPFVARFPRSLDTHVVRAWAPGFEIKERLVTFSDNLILDLSLSPLPADPPSARDRAARRPGLAPARRFGPAAAAAAPGPLPLPISASAAGPELLQRPAEGEVSRRRRIEPRDPYSDDNP